MTNKKFSLRALRINENMTQEESAKKLGVTARTISNWETGKSFPNAEQIKMIEKLYNINYDSIIFLPTNAG